MKTEMKLKGRGRHVEPMTQLEDIDKTKYITNNKRRISSSKEVSKEDSKTNKTEVPNRREKLKERIEYLAKGSRTTIRTGLVAPRRRRIVSAFAA